LLKLSIVPYNKAWPSYFERIRKELEIILEDLNPKIEHFGSTAVPGLSAKPVIDILVGINSVHALDKTIGLMTQAGYIYYACFTKEISNRRLYVGLKEQDSGNPIDLIQETWDSIPHEQLIRLRESHIHIWEVNSPDWIRHIAFRDYLRTHPDKRREYGELKTDLAERKWVDGMEYNNAKNLFVKETEKLALEWYAGQDLKE
jgi:GrpB-like predicted nucleotidyltransferase (UPF0157 family)